MSEPLVERAFLEKLERLSLHWRKSFRGLVGGHNLSRFPGPGHEFLDHRNFYHGDDLRAINWRAYMRFEKFFLKTFQVEPRVPVRLLLDVSASMAAGSSSAATPTKFNYARKLAAALVYVGMVRLDSIVLQPFGSRLLEPFAAGAGRHRFQEVERFLRAIQPEGQTNFHDIIRQFVMGAPHRGLLIVVSDFLDDGDCVRSLQHLADFGHELLIVQLWTPEERRPILEGPLELVDAETGRRAAVNVNAQALRRYMEAFDSYCDSLQRVALQNGGRYVGLSTSTPVEEAVFGPLSEKTGAA